MFKSPPIDQTLYLLGKEVVQKRLQRFLESQGGIS
jgi:hypothetical protein